MSHGGFAATLYAMQEKEAALQGESQLANTT